MDCVPDDALKPSLSQKQLDLLCATDKDPIVYYTANSTRFPMSQEELDEYMMNCDTEVEVDSPMSGALRRRGRTQELGEFFTESGPCSSEVSEESPIKGCKFRD